MLASLSRRRVPLAATVPPPVRPVLPEDAQPSDGRPSALRPGRSREWLLLLLLLLALFGLEVAVVSPVGEFPIHDDWAYYRIARHWAETGQFAYVGWNQMMLVTQAGLGALVIKLFGFSFTGPRCLVMGLALLSLVALYGCGREIGLTPRAAALAMLTVAVTPLHLYGAYSFMTEVPFQALFLAALWTYLRFFRTGSLGALAAATLLALAAFFLRQTALLLPVGALLLSGVLRGGAAGAPGPRRALWLASLLFLAAMGLALLWRSTLPDHDEPGMLLLNAWRSGPAALMDALGASFWRLFCALQYLGLYGLPLAVALGSQALAAARQRPRLALSCAALMAGLAAAAYVLPTSLTHLGRSMPYLDDLLSAYPRETDGFLLRGPGPLMFGRLSRAALTLAALPGAALLLFATLAASPPRPLSIKGEWRGRETRMPPKTPPLHPPLMERGSGGEAAFRLLFAQWLLQFLFVCVIAERVFERYYLLLLALSLLVLTRVLSPSSAAPSAALPLLRWTLPASLAIAAVYLAFSLANLHDFFALQREVAAAVKELQAQGVPIRHIDAGFAWTGWYHPGPVRRERLQPRHSRDTWYLARVFPDLPDDFALSLTRAADRPVLARRSYRAWLPPPGGERDLWILGPKGGPITRG